MKHSDIMIRWLGVATAPLVLAACAEGGGTADAANGSAGEEVDTQALDEERQAMSETAWLTVSEDGAVYITYLDPDGRYRDQRDGQTVFEGTWETNASKQLCFSPEGGKGACWDHGRADSEGVMRATHEDGREIELKRVTYTPLPTSEDGAEETGGD